MLQDLLAITELEPPMGDLFVGHRLDTARAVWAEREGGEADLPKKRILHQRIVRLHRPARLIRLGLRRGQGYHKCGSRGDLDWVRAARVLAYVDGVWREVWNRDDLKAPPLQDVQWFSLPPVQAHGVVVQVRRTGIDDGWSSWNLAMSAFVLEAEIDDPVAPRRERLLRVAPVNLNRLPEGVQAWTGGGEVRYLTKDYEIGFYLTRPGCSWFALRTEDPERSPANVLNVRPPTCYQGPRWQSVGAAPAIDPVVRCDVDGTTSVQGNRVTYAFQSGGQQWTLTWRITAAGPNLQVVREVPQTQQAWHSSAWTLGLRNSVTPSHVLGRLRREGETGALALPAVLVLPTFGAWSIHVRGDGWVRSDCHRQRDLNLLEFKVGERATPEGLYELPAGRHEATFLFRTQRPPTALRPETPAIVRRAVERTQWTALTFRADTATLSNNGASIHCPICMDTWSAVALPQRPILPGFHPAELLRYSLERWLDGGPGYAAGRLVSEGRAHDADDEYLMTGAAALRGLGDYLSQAADASWFARYRPRILQRIAAARERDLDGDGLIESPYRTGTSGSGQWSTCWFDVISFGWKDALANAILHGALRSLAAGLHRFGDDVLAADLRAWAKRLRRSYRPTFWNEKTGWFAGWRCQEGRLHDYAFLPVNGAAVAEGLVGRAEGRAILQRIWAEAERVGLPDPRYGLPGNLHHIPDADLADIMQGYPLGYYQNGGRTHAQTRHFVSALYRVGLRAEADQLLERLCVGLAEAAVFGGNQSGVDWRYWDDRPCGYEGLLTDQFGLLEPIFRRWGRPARRARVSGPEAGPKRLLAVS